MRVFFQIIIPLGILTVVMMTPLYLQIRPLDDEKEQEHTTEAAPPETRPTEPGQTVPIKTEPSTTEALTNACSYFPCENGGTCSNAGSDYKCTCADGFSGNECEITPCSSYPCMYDGECEISGGSFECVCPEGFSGDRCEITPCSTNPCENGSLCVHLLENSPPKCWKVLRNKFYSSLLLF